MNWYFYKPYVSAAQRRAKAAREVARRQKRGQKITPIVIEGRKIATTFWGTAWCDNLESYSDFENRLPRGRTYVRNGSVVHLQIEPGRITALVSGSSMYEVSVEIASVPDERWRHFKQHCAGRIGSLVELLQGRFSKGVMDVVTERDCGLFPKPAEIKMSCSCPDWAGMCKHVAAVLYGVGARLDRQPELLFLLRKVDHLQLIADAVAAPVGRSASSRKKTIRTDELADVFGIELADSATPEPARSNSKSRVSGPAKANRRKSRKTSKPVLASGKPRARAGAAASALAGSGKDKTSAARKTARRKSSARRTASRLERKPARKG